MRAAHTAVASARCLWRQRWLRFVLVGVLNTTACYLVYAALLWTGMPYPIANLGALAFGVLFSFRTHSTYVFGQPGTRRLPRYVVCWVILYALNITLIGAFMRWGLNAYWAGALALAPMVVLSYLVQRILVFGERP